jgi:hypothetical protein
MSASQRRKGASYEREIVNILRETIAPEIRRNLSQSRDSGADILWGDYVFECKRRRKLTFINWFQQAKDACLGNQKPVVICREDEGENMVIVRLTDFLHLLRDKNES